MFEDEYIVPAFIFDDAGKALILDLFLRNLLLNIDNRLTQRAGVLRCILIRRQPNDSR